MFAVSVFHGISWWQLVLFGFTFRIFRQSFRFFGLLDLSIQWKPQCWCFWSQPFWSSETFQEIPRAQRRRSLLAQLLEVLEVLRRTHNIYIHKCMLNVCLILYLHIIIYEFIWNVCVFFILFMCFTKMVFKPFHISLVMLLLVTQLPTKHALKCSNPSFWVLSCESFCRSASQDVETILSNKGNIETRVYFVCAKWNVCHHNCAIWSQKEIMGGRK